MAVCESCAGDEDEELVAVWPVAGAAGPPAPGGDQPELWCESCRDRYPHEPADEDDTSR